ncbi:MAG: hypothetical protein FWD59_06650 [Micrococcales bacterium]|nr:hypothetical protein [Micrococcales bacterium]
MGSRGDHAKLLMEGEFMLSLLEDPAWINRRVENIHVLGPAGDLRRTSLDINVQELVQRANGRFGQGRIPIHLGWQQKGLTLDFSVWGPDGESTSLWSSDRDSAVAFGVLLAIVKEDAPELAAVLSE